MKKTLPTLLSAAAMIAASPASAHHHNEEASTLLMSSQTLMQIGIVALGALAVFLVASRLRHTQRQPVRSVADHR